MGKTTSLKRLWEFILKNILVEIGVAIVAGILVAMIVGEGKFAFQPTTVINQGAHATTSTPVSRGIPPPTETSTAERPDPVAVVTDYWQFVGDGLYSKSWQMLSEDFKIRRHNNDYEDYVRGYKGLNICSIETNNASVIQKDTNFAKVSVKVIYRASSNCQSSEENFIISLIYSEERGTWLYDKTENK